MLRSAALLAMRMENAAVLVFTRSGDLAAKLEPYVHMEHLYLLLPMLMVYTVD